MLNQPGIFGSRFVISYAEQVYFKGSTYDLISQRRHCAFSEIAKPMFETCPEFIFRREDPELGASVYTIEFVAMTRRTYKDIMEKSFDGEKWRKLRCSFWGRIIIKIVERRLR